MCQMTTAITPTTASPLHSDANTIIPGLSNIEGGRFPPLSGSLRVGNNIDVFVSENSSKLHSSAGLSLI